MENVQASNHKLETFAWATFFIWWGCHRAVPIVTAWDRRAWHRP